MLSMMMISRPNRVATQAAQQPTVLVAFCHDARAVRTQRDGDDGVAAALDIDLAGIEGEAGGLVVADDLTVTLSDDDAVVLADDRAVAFLYLLPLGAHGVEAVGHDGRIDRTGHRRRGKGTGRMRRSARDGAGRRRARLRGRASDARRGRRCERRGGRRRRMGARRSCGGRNWAHPE